MQRLVLGLFDTRAAANEVVNELLGKGFSRESIHLTANSSAAPAPAAPHDPAPASESDAKEDGLIRRLLVKLGALPAHTQHPVFRESEQRIFSAGVRRGGVLVAVTVHSAQQLDQAEDALERFGAVDIDERADEWRASGWTEPEEVRQGEPVAPEVAQQAQNIGAIPETPPRRHTRVLVRREDAEAPPPAAATVSAAPAEPLQAESAPDPQPDAPHENAPEPGGIDSDFRMHFGTIYGSSGHEYDYYLPAYRLGAELGRKHRSDWETVQASARAEWEQFEPRRPWETVVDAVHFGFDRTRTGRATILRPAEPPEPAPPHDAGEREPVLPPSPTTSERPM